MELICDIGDDQQHLSNLIAPIRLLKRAKSPVKQCMCRRQVWITLIIRLSFIVWHVWLVWHTMLHTMLHLHRVCDHHSGLFVEA